MKKYTTLSEELNQLSQERKEIIAVRTSEIRLEEITLQHLGEKLGVSQSELAASLELSQREISDLESGQSLELNTLRNVVNALGGTMEIIGKVVERVLNVTGSSCVETTKSLEKSLGEIESQELLPEYYEGEENINIAENQSLKQQ
ncbi:DUF2997 domain-containing protein [Dolichospermum circinale CS-534/05]|uniref:DUF2997 domain-containing protein n=1 Tax=Dolichospermum circinale TaxID=109265 RepID=UPI00233058CF|nr:DUF2997 domain-containing protein [Dolichospermum circinale]MDB9491108.1 DUF2997 domain-containing protein [Dolichospermum circinale CS-534/05]